jgi:hypothetical protein
MVIVERWMPRRVLRAMAAEAVVCTLLAFAFACSVYDPELILPQTSSPTTGIPRAGSGTNGGGGASGSSGGGSGSGSDAGDEDADAAADSGAPTNPFPVDSTACGDGRVTGSERCDVSIKPGSPGACPSECPKLGNCAPRLLNNGGGCQAECVLLELVCQSGDDCCPGKCNSDNDPDCSSSCGDGIVQEGSGETCEPESETPCKTSDADCDDQIPCTVDKLLGSASNCNTVCSNIQISEPTGGDSCCPDGANSTVDSDCPPKCGNGVPEPGEDCDGGMGCDASCKLMLLPAQTSCVEKFGNDACGACACKNCTDTYLACRDGMDAAANKQCNDVLVCAEMSDCFGIQCYCGALCGVTPGPCQAEIEIAAGTTDWLMISQRQDDPTFPVGRALRADTCRRERCSDVCR